MSQYALDTLAVIDAVVSKTLGCLDGLSPDECNWRADTDAANSLYVIASHVVGGSEQNLIHFIAGEPVQRDRDAEFRARGDGPDRLHAQWAQIVPRARDAFHRLDAAALDAEVDHPSRGSIQRRQLLLGVIAHSAEHLGEAQLVRDLLLQRRRGA